MCTAAAEKKSFTNAAMSHRGLSLTHVLPACYYDMARSNSILSFVCQVVAVPGLSKRVKLQLFTSKTLERLSELYSVSAVAPQSALSHSESSKGVLRIGSEPDEQEPLTIRDQVHLIFMDLCTTADPGIVFPPRAG